MHRRTVEPPRNDRRRQAEYQLQVAYGGRSPMTPPKEDADAEWMEPKGLDGEPWILMGVVMKHGLRPAIKQQTDGVAGTADAAVESGRYCSCGW